MLCQHIWSSKQSCKINWIGIIFTGPKLRTSKFRWLVQDRTVESRTLLNHCSLKANILSFYASLCSPCQQRSVRDPTLPAAPQTLVWTLQYLSMTSFESCEMVRRGSILAFWGDWRIFCKAVLTFSSPAWVRSTDCMCPVPWGLTQMDNILRCDRSKWGRKAWKMVTRSSMWVLC